MRSAPGRHSHAVAGLPAFDVCQVVQVDPVDPGPFVSGFAAWLDSGRRANGSAARHVGHVKEFLAWYGVNQHEDVVVGVREFARHGNHQQVASMRLLLEWLADR